MALKNIFPRKLIPFFSGIFIFLLLFTPTFTSAGLFDIDINKIQGSSFSELIKWLYSVLLIVSVGAVFAVIIYGGLEYMTSAGNSQKMKSGLNRIKDATIGVLLIAISYLTLLTINPQLLFLEDINPAGLSMGGGYEDDIPDSWPDLCFLFPGACDEKAEDDYYGSENPVYDPSKGIDPHQSTPRGWPTKGVISSSYGNRCAWWSEKCHQFKDYIKKCQTEGGDCWKFHNGLDIANKCGTPVYATASGTVTTAAFSGGYGNLIIIKHIDNFETRYAHLSSYAVSTKEGKNQVQSGQLIGHMGNTGNSTGCHLHYEVRIKGLTKNPANYL